ncbi:hypothetical protein [Methylosinus sp. PW1]|uniref:hypothetical protein n=1 Tax=Methylosinus sp. PW1 TaxID=107636 RepID=UPI00055BF27E|nr:hypothetical protein [Methylosinus sp. PW1]
MESKLTIFARRNRLGDRVVSVYPGDHAERVRLQIEAGYMYAAAGVYLVVAVEREDARSALMSAFGMVWYNAAKPALREYEAKYGVLPLKKAA